MKWITGILVCMTVPLVVLAQTPDTEIAKYMTMVQNGQVDAVKGEIPSLLAKYPNHPGVLYLQGLTTTEGAEAVRVYQSIVDNFPSSEWADDALYKVYQFYYSLGLYRTAEIKMAQLRKSYPASKYLTAASTDIREMPDDSTAMPAQPVTTPPPAVTAPVTTPAPSKAAANGEHFTLQVGAYTTSANAEKQKTAFEDLGYPVEIITRVKEGRSLFLVLVGTFSSANDARDQGAEIKRKHHVDSIVTTK